MSDPIQSRNMLDASQRDLKALIGMFDSEMFSDEIFGLHAQQSAEKSLKAWLAALGEIYPYTHDISRLLGRLERLDCDVSAYENLVPYTEFAAQVRYVGMSDDAESIDRKGVLAQVKNLYKHVNTVLESVAEDEASGE